MSIKNRIVSRMSRWNLVRLSKQFLVVGLVVSLIGSYYWYSRLYLNDDRKFWVAIENSMATPSVTRTLTSGGTGNQAIQQQQFLFAPQVGQLSKVTYNEKSPTVTTNVITEGRSFLDAQFSRYTKFESTQKRTDGTQLELNDYLNKWEGGALTGEEADQYRLSYIGELVTLVIFGNFDSNFRSEIINNMRSSGVYELNTEAISRENRDGENYIVYPVKVKVKPYVEQLNKAFMYAGYGSFPPLQPDNYNDTVTIPLTIVVHARSLSVSSVAYGGRQEDYSSYGIVKSADRPTAVFATGELETKVRERLQTVQPEQ